MFALKPIPMQQQHSLSVDMAASSAASYQGAFNSNGNGLVIYIYPGCYFSQKVILAFHEKRLKYKPHLVNLFAGEHLQPWFLKLNPNGQIPVLQDGIKVIPNSDSIIEYLEDNFYNGNFPKLQPSKGTEAFQKVKLFTDLLNQVNVDALNFGSICSPELAFQPTMSESERKARLSFLDIEQTITMLQKKFPENREFLEQQKERYRQSNSFHQDTDAIQKEISSAAQVLDQVENELASHKEECEQWWLCCETFTIADISLAVLLNHLDGIGLSYSLVNHVKRPCLKKYKERLRERPTFQTFVLELKLLQRQLEPSVNRPLVFALSAVAVAGLVAAFAMLYKRIRKV